MLAPVVLALVVQLQPGPLDAFRANYASIKAGVDFEYIGGALDGSGERLWSEQKPAFAENHATGIVGRWECDGTTELYRFSSTEEVFALARQKKPRREASKLIIQVPTVPRTEALWDGEFLATHSYDPLNGDRARDFSWWAIQIAPITEEPLSLLDGRGPFYWGFSYTFPQILKAKFPGVTPKRQASKLGGHPVEVESYRQDRAGGGFVQFEVSYDPALGYVPRFARVLAVGGTDTALVKEMYLIEAKPCAAGGFVPTEWYDTFLSVDGFAKRFPDYSPATMLRPDGRVPGGHFSVRNFDDIPGPVALTDLKDVKTIGTPGGWIPVRGKPNALTLAAIKKIAGTRLTNPERRAVLPNLDATELHAYDFPTGGHRRFPWIIAGVVSCLVLAGWWGRRRFIGRAATRVGVLAILVSNPGCGLSTTPVVKLNAAFKDTYVFVPKRGNDLSMLLILRNDGNQPVKIFKADGGCSCRTVDQSPLPCAVQPGKELALPVRMSVPRTTSQQSSRFSFETNQGLLAVDVPYFCLLGNQLEPDALSHTGLIESEPWSFHIIHRKVFRADAPKPSTEPTFPSAFTAERTATTGGEVGGAPGYLYKDVSYRLTLKERGLGLHKSVIALKDGDQTTLVEAPVVWERLPFLSSLPKRVSLGDHPVRVFLHCRDDSVELTRVRTVPAGIRAVITSPREVRISLASNAAPTIDAEIEVETTAEGKSPLRIPVVRYTASGTN